jgi:hypothetical protein
MQHLAQSESIPCQVKAFTLDVGRKLGYVCKRVVFMITNEPQGSSATRHFAPPFMPKKEIGQHLCLAGCRAQLIFCDL